MYNIEHKIVELLKPKEFHSLDEYAQKKYIELIGYPRGSTGDLILSQIISKSGDNFLAEYLAVLIIIIEDLVQCPIRFTQFLSKKNRGSIK